MGKGSNVQKATAARERNQKKMGKTDEERRWVDEPGDASSRAGRVFYLAGCLSTELSL